MTANVFSYLFKIISNTLWQHKLNIYSELFLIENVLERSKFRLQQFECNIEIHATFYYCSAFVWQTFTQSGASNCSQFMLFLVLVLVERHQPLWTNKRPPFQNLFLLRRCIHITFYCRPVLLWCCFIGEFCIFKSQIIPCFASDRGEANILNEIHHPTQTFLLCIFCNLSVHSTLEV